MAAKTAGNISATTILMASDFPPNKKIAMPVNMNLDEKVVVNGSRLRSLFLWGVGIAHG